MGEDEGFIKLLVRSSDERLLGAHIIAPGAGEMIHECSLAMKERLKVTDLAALVHAHPTLSEAIKEAALRQPLHL
jgi:dihydrolipoamide dehydrogenase